MPNHPGQTLTSHSEWTLAPTRQTHKLLLISTNFILKTRAGARRACTLFWLPQYPSGFLPECPLDQLRYIKEVHYGKRVAGLFSSRKSRTWCENAVPMGLPSSVAMDCWGRPKLVWDEIVLWGVRGQRDTQRREVREAQVRTICGVWSVIN